MAADDHGVGHARDHLRDLLDQVARAAGRSSVGADPEHREIGLVDQVDAQALLGLGEADMVGEPAKLGRGLDPAHQLGAEPAELVAVAWLRGASPSRCRRWRRAGW